VVGGLVLQRPAGFEVPSVEELERAMPQWIKDASAGFASPAVTTVKFEE
jgi:hypothetical protein